MDELDFDNRHVTFRKKYDLVVDLHPEKVCVYRRNLARYCIKVAYITGSNPDFSSQAETERLEFLRLRKGVRLEKRRQVPPFDRETLESCDAVFFIGNRHNWATYSGFEIRRVNFIRNTGYSFPRMMSSRKSRPGISCF